MAQHRFRYRPIILICLLAAILLRAQKGNHAFAAGGAPRTHLTGVAILVPELEYLDLALREDPLLSNLSEIVFSDDFYIDLFINEGVTRIEFEEQLSKLRPETAELLIELSRKESSGQVYDRASLKEIKTGVALLSTTKRDGKAFQKGNLKVRLERLELCEQMKRGKQSGADDPQYSSLRAWVIQSCLNIERSFSL